MAKWGKDEHEVFLLCIPADLWAELEKWAADERRSVNGQIEYNPAPSFGKTGSRAQKQHGRAPLSKHCNACESQTELEPMLVQLCEWLVDRMVQLSP